MAGHRRAQDKKRWWWLRSLCGNNVDVSQEGRGLLTRDLECIEPFKGLGETQACCSRVSAANFGACGLVKRF